MKKRKVIFYLLMLVLALVLQYFDVVETFEKPVEDKLYQNGSKVNDNIFVIGIDEETLSTYGDFNNFSRTGVADLINLLMENEEYAPDLIAIDIAYYSSKDKEADAALVEAVKNAGNVILVETLTFGDTISDGNQAILAEKPFTELSEAALAIGHSNYQLDTDGVVRHAMNSVKYDGQIIHSFPMTIYEQYNQKNNIITTLDGNLTEESFYVVYADGPRAFYGSVGAGCSFSKVLSGEYPVRAFKDSIVFIGAYATGLRDNYYTSIDKQTQMYGVEIHANLVNQLINNEHRTEISGIYKLAPTFILGLLAFVAVRDLETKYYIPINVFLSVMYVMLCYAFNDYLDVLLPVLIPTIVPVLMTLTAIVIDLINFSREKKDIIAKYSKFMSPDVALKIANEGEESLALGGANKSIAVLFVDIRNFTSLSEVLKPEEVVGFLNGYYELTTRAIFDNEGMVDKFVGDETMAIFNAPLDVDNYVEKAVLAGLDMIKYHDEFDANLPDKLKGKVGYGIGVHYGEAVVGNIGTARRMDYTCIGDVVNTAARLQGQAKANELIVSKDVYELIKDKFVCEFADIVKLKGKAKETEMFRVLSKKTDENNN